MSLPIPPMPPAGAAGAIGGIGAATAPVAAPAPGFADAFQNGLQAVSDLEKTADVAIQDVATGGDTSIQELMTATSQAQLGVEVLTHVRDKAVEAYQEIMRMQV